MRRGLLLFTVLASLWCGAAQQRKAPRPPELRVIEATARRGERLINVDGRVVNCGLRPLVKLTLLLHFRTADGKVITTQRGTIEEDVLPPGDESEFRWQMRDHARAVEFTIEAVEGPGRELTVDKPGPYPVE